MSGLREGMFFIMEETWLYYYRVHGEKIKKSHEKYKVLEDSESKIRNRRVTWINRDKDRCDYTWVCPSEEQEVEGWWLIANGFKLLCEVGARSSSKRGEAGLIAMCRMVRGMACGVMNVPPAAFRSPWGNGGARKWWERYKIGWFQGNHGAKKWV